MASDNLKAGPALDLAVAKAVGWRLGIDADGEEFTARGPSTNTADALAALEATGARFRISGGGDSGYRASIVCEPAAQAWANADTLPHAASLAIVRWAAAKGAGNG